MYKYVVVLIIFLVSINYIALAFDYSTLFDACVNSGLYSNGYSSLREQYLKSKEKQKHFIKRSSSTKKYRHDCT